jgi:hypothetical protein
VLKLGFAPGHGSVKMLVTASAFDAGNIDLILSFIKGFLIGINPKDSN